MPNLQPKNCKRYSIQELSPREFEELVARIFEQRIKKEIELKEKYSRVELLPEGADQGKDIILWHDESIAGIIQCKRLNKNLSDRIVLEEMVKTLLFLSKEDKIRNDIELTYIICVALGYTKKALELLNDFKKGLKFEEVEQIYVEIIRKTISLQNCDLCNSEELYKYLKSIKIEYYKKEDINRWILENEEVELEFFNQIGFDFDKLREIMESRIDEETEEFTNKYKSIIPEHLNKVQFIGYSIGTVAKPKNITADGLYIDQCFYYDERFNTEKSFKGENCFEGTSEKNEFSAEYVIESSERIIILGDAGAGKSLQVKKYILDIIKNEIDEFEGFIPFRIELRKYNQKRGNILDYLTELISSEYQLSVDKRIIEHIFATKPIIIFFDGLDEVFSVSDKKEVSECIMNFGNVHSNLIQVITSRFRGYDEVEFSKKYKVFSIKNFDDQQIKSFVGKFYNAMISNKKQREYEVDICISQLNSVDESLKRNPLILSLITLLVMNNLTIPDNKLDVYKACTETLVDNRDNVEKKEINSNLSIGSGDKRALLNELAFWQYEMITNNKTVKRDCAKEILITYLKTREKFEDHYVASEAVEEFLTYVDKRSIYFDDNFTHKTFLEYYTADHIFRRYHSGKKDERRDEILRKYVGNQSWHIVFELFFSMIDSSLDESTVIDELISLHIDSESEMNLVFFVGLLRNTKNISSNTKKNILHTVLNYLIKNKDKDKNNNGFEPNILFNSICNLINDTTEKKNLRLIIDIMIEFESCIQDELKVTFFILYSEFLHFAIRDIEIDIDIPFMSRLEEFALTDLTLYSHLHFLIKRDKANLKDILINSIKMFGLGSIFKRIEYVFVRNYFRFPILTIYLNIYFNKNTDELMNGLNILVDNNIELSKLIKFIDEQGFRIIVDLRYFVTHKHFSKYVPGRNSTFDLFLEQIAPLFLRENSFDELDEKSKCNLEYILNKKRHQ